MTPLSDPIQERANTTSPIDSGLSPGAPTKREVAAARAKALAKEAEIPKVILFPCSGTRILTPLPPEEWDSLGISTLDDEAGVGLGRDIRPPGHIVAYSIDKARMFSIQGRVFSLIPEDHILAVLEVIPNEVLRG